MSDTNMRINEEEQCDSFQSEIMPKISGLWSRLWKESPPDLALTLIGLTVALLMFIPISYVILQSVTAGSDRWLRLLDTRIPGLLYNTLTITLATTLVSIVLGVSLAWLVYRCNIPGRKLWQWIFALPLMLPSYVGAVAYIMVFGPTGWINQTLGAGASPLNVYSFSGVLLVLSMFKFPYVFLVVGASLRRLNRSHEDTARSLGLNTWSTFWKVNLPLLRPAIGAGAILTALCVLSEFGVVALLRYNTFTAAIYYQMDGFDRQSASILSAVLIVLTLLFLWIESANRRKQRFYQFSGTYRAAEPIDLKGWRLPGLIWVLCIFMLSVLLPLAILFYWTVQGISLGAIGSNFWVYTVNSIQVAGLAALICMFLALPVIYLRSRYPSVMSDLISKLSSSGYSLPGVIVALGLIYLFNNYIPWLYNTFFLISIAYVIRFLPQAMQYGDASLSQISPRIDEAARNLGLGPFKVITRVIVPLISPGLLAGGGLVFVSAIKELPATLLLRPPGFDTLAVRVWVEASEAVYHMAAPAALLVVIVSLFPLKLMLSKY